LRERISARKNGKKQGRGETGLAGFRGLKTKKMMSSRREARRFCEKKIQEPREVIIREGGKNYPLLSSKEKEGSQEM